jgi:gamma-glutamyltranspeptidase
LEPFYGPETIDSLRTRGHIIAEDPGYYGGGQVIMVDPESGALLAGAEPRNDGAAVAY